jgi:hypothetical protein
MYYGRSIMVTKKLKLRVIDALIDTAERTTELDKVYDENRHDSVSWEQIYQVRAELAGE